MEYLCDVLDARTLVLDKDLDSTQIVLFKLLKTHPAVFGLVNHEVCGKFANAEVYLGQEFILKSKLFSEAVYDSSCLKNMFFLFDAHLLDLLHTDSHFSMMTVVP
ncbi:hypothetical protein ES703_02089 [subsurface metagenome]